MKVRVKSDGKPFGSTVTDEAGVVIEGVRAVTWRHEAGELPVVDVELLFIKLDELADAKMIGPNGKEVRRVEYADGTVDEFSAD